MHTRPSGRRLLRCGDCGAWTCSWRLIRRRLWVFAVVVSCFVPWCVLACGAACVPCLACVWRALLARACCCAGAGTHPLSGGPVWLHGGPCWRTAAARCAAVGCVYVGGGGFGSSPLAFPALSLCPFSPACPACLPFSYPLGWPWLDGWSWWSDMVFPSCRAAWAGFVLGAGCSCGVPCRVYGVLGLLAPVRQRACPVCGVACAASWAAWLLFTGVHHLCVVLCVRCPGPPGSCSPVCTLCVWCCVYGVLGLLAPVHRCARSVCGVVCTVSWASWLLFTGVHALCVVLRVRCPGPPGSCSPACTLCVWCCVHGVLGLLAPVHRCACSVCGVACTASWASWLLFTGVHALCVVLRVRRPGPPASCSPVCTLCVWCCMYGVLGLLAPVHRCARSVCGVACTVSWASWLLFTGVHALCAVLCARCPGPPGSCSPVCTICVWCRVDGVLGLLAPVHRCARSVCRVVCMVSRASWLLFTGVHALCVVLRVRCPGSPASCSPVCTLCVWCCVYGVLGLLAPVHWCARSMFGVVCAVSWTLAPVHLCACSGVLCRVYGVLGPLAPVHRCARFVCGVVCAVSWASWLLFSDARARCVVSFVPCSGLLGSCPPACPLCVRCRVCGLLGLLALLCWCARVVCVVWRVWCPGTLGSWSPVSRCVAVCVVSGVRCCVCGVLGLPAPVHWCARPVCGVVWAVSWAAWLLFSGVLVRFVVWCVRCPGPRGSCSPVCALGVRCFVFGDLGLLAPVHRCACVVCCVVCVVSRATWLPFTGVPAWRVLCRVFGVLGPVAPVHRRAVCLFGVLCVVCGVLGHVAPVHRCACSVCCVVCAVWVWVRARVRHTVAATLRTLCFCLHMDRHRGERRSELATGIPATKASVILWCLTYSSRPGLFDFGDAQEEACLNACMAVYAIYSFVCGLFAFCDAQE